jgi:hypothetical protein
MDLNGLQDHRHLIYPTCSPAVSGLAQEPVPSSFPIVSSVRAALAAPSVFLSALIRRNYFCCLALAGHGKCASAFRAQAKALPRFPARVAGYEFNERGINASVEWSGFSDRFLQCSS